MRRSLFALALLAGGCAQGGPMPPCRDCPDMIAVPGQAFLLGRTEITYDHWAACARDGACRADLDDQGWGRGTRPVMNITWDEAVAFTRWMSARSGLICRLPTEAEWEFAARAGTTTAYWWGDLPEIGRANCRDCLPQPHHGTLPTGSFAPNPWGFFDMNGNVWEWTSDCWLADQPRDSCAKKVIKGGGWYYHSPNATAWAHAGNDRSAWNYSIGFRVLCERK